MVCRGTIEPEKLPPTDDAAHLHGLRACVCACVCDPARIPTCVCVRRVYVCVRRVCVHVYVREYVYVRATCVVWSINLPSTGSSGCGKRKGL